MNAPVNELDVVALLKDSPKLGLVAGQVGTVVEVLADGVYEVEFSGDDGKAYCMAALRSEELIVLHYAPVPA